MYFEQSLTDLPEGYIKRHHHSARCMPALSSFFNKNTQAEPAAVPIRESEAPRKPHSSVNSFLCLSEPEEAE